jgi:hypothetical protein
MTSTSNNHHAGSEANLTRQTLRAVALLVGACVLFVGALSVIAVAVTSRAIGGGASEASTTDTAPNAKKPLSI